jgi:hypothetical protein
MVRLRAVLCVLPLALLAACQGVRTLSDPTLTMHTKGGSELGVSTDYGIVFLGRTAQAGRVEVTVWYGDGPNIEKSVIEPIGHGIYTVELEIRPPTIPMSFVDPLPGSELLIIGRKDGKEWSEYVTVQQDPHVTGIITTVPVGLRDAPDQVGAGVYIVPEGDEHQRRLVGLVSGRMTIEPGGREYLTVVGPTDLWRLVSHRREPRLKKRWVYREDIL